MKNKIKVFENRSVKSNYLFSKFDKTVRMRSSDDPPGGMAPSTILKLPSDLGKPQKKD